LDLGLYTQVLGRHRLLVTVGIALSLALAMLSYVRISSTGLTYRASEVWSNEATLEFAPAGSLELRSGTEPDNSSRERIASLVELYSVYATSDPVIEALQRRGLLTRKEAAANDSIEAKPVPSIFGQPTPLMKISARGDSPAAATLLTVGATDAFIAYFRTRQNREGIRERQRVQVEIVDPYREPMLIKPRSRTGLIVILLAGLTATVAAAFIRDNMQRTKKRETGDPDVTSLPEAVSLAAVNRASKPVAPLADAAGLTDEELSGADREVAHGGGAPRWAPRSPR
jgi:capsular polysaccharide biosynthesis protein